jgi:hypothetical protein
MPLSNNDLLKLQKAVTWSRDKLDPFLEERHHMVSQYVGPHWSESNPKLGRPVNMIELFVIVVLSQLSGRNPKISITSKHREVRPSAYALELQTNVLAEQIGLGDSIEASVLDSLFGLGVVKLGERAAGQFNYGDQLFTMRKPYCQPIDMANWVHDMAARRWNQIHFEGNYYRIERSTLESGAYNEEAVERFMSTAPERSPTSREHDTHDIQTSDDPSSTEYRRRYEVLDLYLPHERRMLTLPPTGPWDQDSILRERIIPKEEPEPYHKLVLNRVPDATMPLAPLTNLRDLDEAMNKLMVKAIKRANRQKDNPVYGAGGEESAQTIKNAVDGEWIFLANPVVQNVKTGGIDGQTMALVLGMRDMFSYHAGNLDLFGGLGNQSPTATQDKLLSQNASQRISTMQLKAMNFVQGIMRDLAWYTYHDPVMEYQVEKVITGTDQTILSTFGPDQRSAPFLDFAFKIEPYSAQHRSPQERWMVLQQALQALAPFIQMGVQQGTVPNVAAMARAASQMLDIPEFDEFFEIAQPPPYGPGSPAQPATKSPVTQRINQRVSTPGITSEGRNRMLMEQMMGQGMQQKELDAMSRTG